MSTKTSEAQGVVNEAAVKRAVAAVMSAPPGISVEAYVRIVLEAALAESVPQRYDLDSDPDGIRAGVTVCVQAALYCGSINVNPPPEGHWLSDFWAIGRANARVADVGLSHSDLCRLCRVFNDHSELHLAQDRRISGWLGKRVAESLTGERNDELA
jgi:hypothetical protein